MGGLLPRGQSVHISKREKSKKKLSVLNPDPEFPFLFHDNPASQNSVISIQNTVVFANTASRANILANSAPRGRSSALFRQESLRFHEPHTINKLNPGSLEYPSRPWEN